MAYSLLDELLNPPLPVNGLWVSSWNPTEEPGVEYAYRATPTTCGRGVIFQTFAIKKTTTSGFWIDYWGKPRFVCGRFAHRTRDEALRCLLHRQHRYLGILAAKRDKTKKFLALAEASLNGISATAELHNTNT